MSELEPICTAQKHVGKTTAKQLLGLVRSGSSVSLHGRATEGRASYSDSFCFEVSTTRKDAQGSEIRSLVDVPGYVTNGHTSERKEVTSTFSGSTYLQYTEPFRPEKGFWYLYSGEHLRDVLELLPRDAEVSFHVYLDAGTHEYLVGADTKIGDMRIGGSRYSGLHADHLYLRAEYRVRGKIRSAEFLINACCAPHNSSRFGL